MSKIIDGIISAPRQQVKRAYEVLGGGRPALAQRSSIGEFIRGVGADAPPDVTTTEYATLGGGAVGYFLGSRYGHPLLGVFAGASAARNAPALLKVEERRLALCNMAITGAAIAAALLVPKHPAMAFVAGGVAAGAAVHLGGFRK